MHTIMTHFCSHGCAFLLDHMNINFEKVYNMEDGREYKGVLTSTFKHLGGKNVLVC